MKKPYKLAILLVALVMSTSLMAEKQPEASVERSCNDYFQNTSTEVSEVAFVDTQIDDYQILVGRFHPSIEVVLINANENGLNKMCEFKPFRFQLMIC